jgi:hypothetical protein
VRQVAPRFLRELIDAKPDAYAFAGERPQKTTAEVIG